MPAQAARSVGEEAENVGEYITWLVKVFCVAGLSAWIQAYYFRFANFPKMISVSTHFYYNSFTKISYPKT